MRPRVAANDLGLDLDPDVDLDVDVDDECSGMRLL